MGVVLLDRAALNQELTWSLIFIAAQKSCSFDWLLSLPPALRGRMGSAQTSSDKADIPFQLHCIYLRKPLCHVLATVKDFGSIVHVGKKGFKVKITGLSCFKEVDFILWEKKDRLSALHAQVTDCKWYTLSLSKAFRRADKPGVQEGEQTQSASIHLPSPLWACKVTQPFISCWIKAAK